MEEGPIMAGRREESARQGGAASEEPVPAGLQARGRLPGRGVGAEYLDAALSWTLRNARSIRKHLVKS